MNSLILAREIKEGDDIRVAGITHRVVAANVDADDVVRLVAFRTTNTGSATINIHGDTAIEVWRGES